MSYIANDRLSDLIGSIYGCALDPGLWPQTLGEICQELDLRTGVVSLIRLADGLPMLAATSGFEPEWISRLDHYADGLVSLWGGEETIQALPLHEPAVLSQVNPRAIDENSDDPFHLQFNRPQGFVDAIAVGVSRDEHAVGTIGFNRHSDMGLIGPRETEVMRLLVPHLQRAVTVSRVLDLQKVAVQNMEAALHGLRVPIVLVARDLRVLFANAAAEQVFLAKEGLSCLDGYLHLRLPSLQRALVGAVAKVSQFGATTQAAPFGIPLAAMNGNWRSVHILPLSSGRTAWPSAREEAFALIFSPRHLGTESSAAIMSSLFALTVGETRVLERILNGRTVQETAQQLGIGVSTVRTHMLRIFDKTGVHRQAELISLAASFTPLTS